MEHPPRRVRREFSAESKARTVESIESLARSVGAVCRELDLTETAVRRWVQQARIDGGLRRGSQVMSAPSSGDCGVRTRCCEKSVRS